MDSDICVSLERRVVRHDVAHMSLLIQIVEMLKKGYV